MYIIHYYTVHCCYLYCTWSYFNMYILWHGPCVCVFMYGQATESRWVCLFTSNDLLKVNRSIWATPEVLTRWGRGVAQERDTNDLFGTDHIIFWSFGFDVVVKASEGTYYYSHNHHVWLVMKKTNNWKWSNNVK